MTKLGVVPTTRSDSSTASHLREFFPKVFAKYGPLAARQYMYRAEAVGLIVKGHSADNQCNDALVQLRERGTLPWGAVLDASRSWEPAETEHPGGPLKWLDYQLDALDGIENGYSIPIWANQRQVPVVLTEKEGLIPYFVRVTARYGVTVYAVKGQAGKSHLHEHFLPWARRIAESGRTLRTLYLGDHDDDGYQIEDSLNETLRQWGLETPTERLALTAGLVARHKLPRIPGNHNSSVFRKYIPDGLKTEIESLDPKLLAQLIERAIVGCIDADAADDTAAEEEKARERIRRAVRPVLGVIGKARVKS